MSDTLVVNEIYLSLQGESTFAGLPCIFIRLTACNLRCSYCDTAYAFGEGKKQSLTEIIQEVRRLAKPFPSLSPDSRMVQLPSGHQIDSCSRPEKLPLVELTGGEPLLQKNALPLMSSLCDEPFTVLLETSGALDISPVDQRVHRIMDLKCPSSGEVARNRWANLGYLRETDEIKFVIGTSEDYDWARTQLADHKLASRCPILFSWVQPLAPQQQDNSLRQLPPGQHPISRQELAEKIIADALPVRFQAQLHKIMQSPQQRGV